MEIKGDIHVAMLVVIQELIKGEKTHQGILYEWDKLRGSDRFENYIRKDNLLKYIENAN